jgi:hypothetical protein
MANLWYLADCRCRLRYARRRNGVVADFKTDKFGFYGKVLLQARNGGIF